MPRSKSGIVPTCLSTRFYSRDLPRNLSCSVSSVCFSEHHNFPRSLPSYALAYPARTRARWLRFLSSLAFFSPVYEIPLPRVPRARSRKLPFPLFIGLKLYCRRRRTVKPDGLCARQPPYLHLKRALWHEPRPRQSGELAI